MAPLYKRYVPPKSNAEKPTDSAQSTHNQPPALATPTPEKKRKRERSQEEIAERKAKKLKKKGIDPATVADGDTTVDTVDGGQDAGLAPAGHEDDGETKRQPMKKRHKLEKEARKARKAAKQDESAKEGTFDESRATASPEKNEAKEAAVATANGTAGLQTKEIIRETAEGPSERPQPKKRRHKLEGVLELAKSEEAHSEDEEHLRKHTAVLGKFQKSAKRAIQHQQEESFDKLAEQPVVRHLELPPPERTPTPEFESEDAALPPWVAKPTIVTGDKKVTFKELGIAPETADRLSKLGFAKALPVQQALVPLLMPPGMSGATHPPGTEDVLPDVAVGAPTGSGKTIAYLLPMIEALRHHSQHGRLNALIIVPTPEILLQVAAVAESLVKGSSIKVGMATSTGRFKDEQDKIIKRGARYDPECYTQLVNSAKSQIYPPNKDSEDFQSYIEETGEEDMKRQQWIQDTVRGLVGHVPTYSSTIDILVATPGRLMEHLNNTLGFNLVHLQWLVIDEADALLDNQYEGFVESLNTELTRSRTEEEQDSREKRLRSQGMWDDRKERRMRKAILSASMTRDISKLSSLKLQRPKMIVVRGSDATDGQASVGAQDSDALRGSSVQESVDGFELPYNLVEYCVPVGDGSEKPLVAVELLNSKVIGDRYPDAGKAANDSKRSRAAETNTQSDSDSDSDSDDSSSLSSDDSDSSSSASDSDDDSEVEENTAHPGQDSSIPDQRLPRGLSAIANRPSLPSSPRAPTVLIFTSSNESANRLSHLLQGLKPEWKSWITTLVKAKPGKARIRSKADEPAIVISTDRAARGLDALSNRSITHVIQYDVPRSLTSYVHRVGRTARAGRDGDAWTLYTHAEARWFVNEITKASKVRRRTPVERVKLFSDDGMRERYQTVLAGMRDEVFGAAT